MMMISYPIFRVNPLHLVISTLCFFILLAESDVSAQESVAYFDHKAHGIGSSQLMLLCRDGLDNDSDGDTDHSDPGCNQTHQKALTCTKCHTSPSKKMGHSDCKPCHDVGRTLSHSGTISVPYCRSCHINSTVFRFPPYRSSATSARYHLSAPEGGWSKIGLNFDHVQHAKWTTCESCHSLLRSDEKWTERERRKFKREVRQNKRANRGAIYQVDFRFASHEQCAACHSQTLGPSQPVLSVSMKDCSACHLVQTVPAIVKMKVSQTTGFFNHIQHAKLVSADLPCKLCHASEGLDPETNRIQLPQMKTCSSCHGGVDAFDLGTANCQRCHVESIAP